ncbi:MAG: tRNA pseudouridine(13) synthase TruD [Thermoplasmata archaeon HGW-Thermoplasmata-1]|nr:MAG: tRNA pseudouridine(13) synthase TruD [Thermoplasmata archaeon HGW-Thermoplasmata-1]
MGASERESSIGLEVFYTDAPGLGGKIKSVPEDFIVDEVSLHPPEKDGRYTVARVTSLNWETNALVSQFSKRLRISRNSIGFAGTKDKRALTSQLMSFPVRPAEVEKLSIPGVGISGAYTSDKGLYTGDLIGNRFEINIRNLRAPREEIAQRIKSVSTSLEEYGGFPNFFGVQRFGVVRSNTHLIGKLIVNGDIEGAVRAYMGMPYDSEPEEIKSARLQIDDANDDFAAALKACHPSMNFECAMLNHLVSKPCDWAGALLSLPNNLLKMFIHAYQSYLFNRMLSERIRQGVPLNAVVKGDIVFPARGNDVTEFSSGGITVTADNIDKINRQVSRGKAFVSGVLFGMDSEFAGGVMGGIERKVVETEGICRRDFFIPAIPDLSSRGLRRMVLCPLKGFRYELSEDSVNPDASCARLSFELPKGCYATSLLREFMKAEIINY